ncbi:hypothetical protein [Rhizobium sp. L9]|uniref:hypothetical protein n=1 Tax=Rhizobium sp. L9 TaxID=1340738 RepID=UPI0011436CE6|nr:hypothetical protein [Rhizobium sp. L9]
MSTLGLIFFAKSVVAAVRILRLCQALLRTDPTDCGARIFLSGIIQKSGPFAAVDVKAKGKH